MQAAGTLDLGTLAGPLFLFGAPAGNLPATQAVLAAAEAAGIPAGQRFCTGGVAGDGGDAAAACAGLLRAAGVHLITAGNEDSVAPGPERDWLDSRPARIRFRFGNKRFVMLHGAPEGPERSVYASTPISAKKAMLAEMEADAIIAGHPGLPFSQIVDGRLWLNPGSAGRPANDGTPRVWFAVASVVPDGIAVRHEAVDYDHAGAVAALRAAGAADAARMLETGLWPEDEALPETEHRRRGERISPRRVFWPEKPLHGMPSAPRAGVAPGARGA